MSKSPFVLGIIPARGGSKGIKDKNIFPLAGKPLIGHTIEAAKRSSVFSDSAVSDIVLSTDSQKIADAAAASGLVCDHFRPAHLATDEAKSLDVILYEIERYEQEKGHKIDIFVLLQPTTPLRTSEDIDGAFAAYQAARSRNPNVFSLISVYKVHGAHPRYMYRQAAEEGLIQPYNGQEKVGTRRQDMEAVYVRNGALYITDRDYLFNSGQILCETPAYYEMPEERSVNIDAMFDIRLADFLLSSGA